MAEKPAGTEAFVSPNFSRLVFGFPTIPFVLALFFFFSHRFLRVMINDICFFFFFFFFGSVWGTVFGSVPVGTGAVLA